MKHIFTISLCFLALSLSVYGQVPDYIPSDGLVAWYPFNGNALDESFNGHDANVVGATLSEDRFGSFESAYLFDGDDRIFPSNYEDFPLQERTTSIWVKSNVLATGGRCVFGYGGANCGDSWMLTYNNQGNLPSSAFAYEFQGHCNNQAVSSPMAPEDFISWHHIVGRTSQSGTDIFIDGILETHSDLFVSNTVPNCAVLGALPSPSGLCEYQDSNNQLWDGLLDDFGVWNRALTDLEILGVFQAAPAVLGCTNQDACNFDEEAVVDDGTCYYENECGVCGGVSLAGCTDSYACNYDFEAGCDDGSCDYTCCPGPGCCDVGTVWDIESQTCIVLYPSDSNFDGCVDLNDLMDLLSAYGVCAVSGFTTCGDLLGYQGYDYQTVQIGEQCWFAENLQAELYQSGDQIPLISSTDMVDGPTPVYKCIYDDDIMNRDQMGYLYSWYTTIQETQVCPNGWKVPSLEDFNFLFDEIGGLNQAGNHLKSEPPIWNGADTYGFSGLPSGYYNHPYTSTSDVFGYYFLDQICYLWTSTYSGETTPYYIMFRSGNNHAEIFSSAGNYAEDAMSIRCIKD